MTGLTAASPAALVRRHLLAAAAVAVGLIAALVGLEWGLATAEADRITREAATRVAERVSSTLSTADLTSGVLDAQALDDQLEGFFASGTVARIKVWQVEGETVRVIYSDEAQQIGDERAFSPPLAERLDREGVVVLDVPADIEHRFEHAEGRELREAFVGFTDAAGTPLRLEVYVPVFRDAWVASTLAVYLPVLVGGIALMTAALLPLSVNLARRLTEADRDRRTAIDFGLRSRERERLRLARRLHDDVLQNLAGSALALQALASAPDPERLRAIGATLSDDARTLRSLLDDDAALDRARLTDAIDDAASSARTAGLPVHLDVDAAIEPDAATTRLLVEATRELLRNVRLHADATRANVAVQQDADGYTLSVSDDGHGFAPGRSPSDRHGLRLLRRAFAEVEGDLSVVSNATGTTVCGRVPGRSEHVIAD